MQKNIQISVIAGIAVALLVSTALLPLGAQQALAKHYPKHHHSVHISQKIHQENNFCSAECENTAVNSIGNSGSITITG